MIPGSHKYGDRYADALEESLKVAPEKLGIDGSQVPAVPMVSNPGDVVVFNQNCKHSAWGGSNRRRMFTINCTYHFADDELHLLRNELLGFARFWVEEPYGEAMLRSATPKRMVHLRQVLANHDHLPEAVRKAKETMTEPSRG